MLPCFRQPCFDGATDDAFPEPGGASASIDLFYNQRQIYFALSGFILPISTQFESSG